MDIIHQFLDQNMALVFFIYGLTFVLLGVVAVLQFDPQSRFRLVRSLWALAVFGILHGLAEWGYIFIPLQMQTITREVVTTLEIGHVSLLIASYVFLFQFGLSLYGERIGRPYRYVRFLPAVAFGLWLLGFCSGVTTYRSATLHYFLTNAEALGRYFFVLPGAILSGLAFLKLEEELVGQILYEARLPARAGAIAFLTYGLLSGLVVPAADFFPANIINAYYFHELLNLPVQIFRAITVLCLTYCIFRLLEYFAADYACRLEQAECQQLVLNERLQISRDLHDGILQSVYAVGLDCENIKYLIETDPVKAKSGIDQSIANLNKLIAEIREYIDRLRLDQSAVKTLYEQLVEIITEFKATDNIETVVDLLEVKRLHLCPKQAEQVTNIIREALNNIKRHAEADTVTIIAQDGKRGLWFKIEDNGRGFRLPSGWRSRFNLGHQGISNMRERAKLVGGELEIKSKPGEGTIVSLYIPKGSLNQLCGGGSAFCGYYQTNSGLVGR